MRNILYSLLYLFSITFVLGQNYYNIEIGETGTSEMIIFSASISTLDIGDEVGIFDSNALLSDGDCSDQYGELLVGSGTY